MREEVAGLERVGPLEPGRRTAVLIVAGEESAPERALQQIRWRFGAFYDQIVFVTVGLFDQGTIEDSRFAGEDPGLAARRKACRDLRSGLDRAREAGMESLSCVVVGTDPAREVERVCVEFSARSPGIMFFLGKVVFSERRWYHRILHDRTAEDIQRRLERLGIPVAILPVVLPE